MIAFAGPETITVVLIVALVVFGGSKIPELARSLGKAKGEFQKGLSEEDQAKSQTATTPAPAAQDAPAPAPPAAQAPAAPEASVTPNKPAPRSAPAEGWDQQA
jgi:TatA/E family protein of Tat protein translocase